MAGLHILGAILGCSDFAEGSGLYCTYKFETGLDKEVDWQVLGGSAEGCTHVDDKGADGADSVWDQAIDVHYAVSTFVGWPRLRVNVWKRNEVRNEVLLIENASHLYCAMLPPQALPPVPPYP